MVTRLAAFSLPLDTIKSNLIRQGGQFLRLLRFAEKDYRPLDILHTINFQLYEWEVELL
jgi:hypothetical protein